MNNNLVEKSRTIESDSISDEGTIDNYESELCDKLSNLMEDHGETKVNVKFKKTSKTKEVISRVVNLIVLSKISEIFSGNLLH